MTSFDSACRELAKGLALTAAALLSACSVAAGPQPATAAARPETLESAYGTGSLQELTIDVSGSRRTALIYTPSGKLAAHPKAVLVLHGYKGDAAVSRYYGMERQADEHGFYVVYPFAPGEEWSIGKNFPATTEAIRERNDGAYLLATIDTIVRERRVDPQAVFIAGQSMGGIMAISFACDHADRIRAIAVVASGMTSGQLEACKPSDKVSLLMLLGGSDPVLPPIGGKAKSIAGADGNPIWLMDYPDTLDFWARANGCATNPKPSSVDDRKASVHVVTYPGCGSFPVKAVVIDAMGHRWPGTNFQERLAELRGNSLSGADLEKFLGPPSFTLDGAQEVWRFFRSQ